MWATRPHLASIFEKLLDQKTFSLPAARFFRLFPKNSTPFPRNSTKKFDSRKKTCYNTNGCRSMTVAVDFFMEIYCGGDRLSPASFHNDLWIMEKESGNERCSNTGIFNGCGFGPPSPFTAASTWTWIGHPVSGLHVLTKTPC